MTVHLDLLKHCYLTLTTFQTNDVGFPARRVIRKRYQNPWKKFCKLDWLHERSTADPYSLVGFEGPVWRVKSPRYSLKHTQRGSLSRKENLESRSLWLKESKRSALQRKRKSVSDSMNQTLRDRSRLFLSSRNTPQLYIKLNSSTKVLQFIKYF